MVEDPPEGPSRHVRRPSATELDATRVTGRASEDRPPINALAATMTEQRVRATVHPMTSTNPAEALLSLAEQLPPVLIAVDTHRHDGPVHHDIAYQLIRHAPWPVLATVGDCPSRRHEPRPTPTVVPRPAQREDGEPPT